MTRFYKVLVNMQPMRENPPFFGVYYIKGHKDPRVGDLLYIKSHVGGYEPANMKVAGFSRGAIRPEWGGNEGEED